jgi:hypothetical protein
MLPIGMGRQRPTGSAISVACFWPFGGLYIQLAQLPVDGSGSLHLA